MAESHKNGNHRSPVRYAISFVDAVTAMKYQTLFLLWIVLAILFASIYFGLEYFPGHGPEPLMTQSPLLRFLDSLYYSIITATSTGYGDITPHGFSKVLASLQSMLSLFIFAVFVTKLVSHKQDAALYQIHKLTFEDVFHNIREGFHIVRKDCDRIITSANHQHHLSQQDYEDLATAYRMAQSFLRRIPDFYDPENRLYRIDVRREELLHDGLLRTLKRFHHLLEVLTSKHIHFEEDNESLEELREFLQLTTKTVHYWQQYSPHNRNSAFEKLFTLTDDIHQLVERVVEK